MHEASIAQSIIDIVTEQVEKGGFRSVSRVAVKVGHLSAIVPESLDFAFKALARGTAAGAATLEINEVAGEGRCRSCEHAFEADSFFVICPECSSGDVEIVGGDELTIESMDVEQ
jgi:hydrogenase nickel incorporation protein HypA/HybF